MKAIHQFAVLALLATSSQASAISSAWVGGSGNWTDTIQWAPSVVPNNGFPGLGPDTYGVTINSGGIDVVNLLTQTVFLDSLTIGRQATLNVNDQGLQLGSAASTATLLTNAGAMNFTNAATLALDFSNSPSASNSGTISLGDESELFLQTSVSNGTGTFTNSGNLNLQSNPRGSQIFLQGGGAVFTINGGGNLTMSDNAANLISGVLGTESLLTDNKISGAGTIGNLTNFTNNGSIIANGTNALVLNMDYSVGTALLTGAAANNGSMSVANGSRIVLQAGNSDYSLINNATISVNSTGFITQLVYDDKGNRHSLLLSGTGTLSLSDSANNFLVGANGDETLVNQSMHTIAGAGTIAGFGNGIINNGTIIANGVNPLTVGISVATALSKPGITNNGLVQVNDGSTLQILSSNGGAIANAGSITLNANTGTSTLSFNDVGAAGTSVPGITFALSGNGTLMLSDNPGNRIMGVNGDEGFEIDTGSKLTGAGTISNLGGFEALTNLGTIIANGHNPLILDGTTATNHGFSALSNFGLVQVNDGSEVQIRSASGASIHNWAGFVPGNGTITLNALTSTSTLSFNDLGHGALFSFDGCTSCGSIVLSDNPGNRIVGVSGDEGLNIGQTQTLSGAGTISNLGGFEALTNEGTIIANGHNPLILDATAATRNGFSALSNFGLLQVKDGGEFDIQSSSGASIHNWDTAPANGIITLNALTSTSKLGFNDLGHRAVFTFDGCVSTCGSIIMSDNPGNRIVGISGDEQLLNGPAHTIIGAGTIGNFGGGLINQGNIIASGVNPLIIDITAATQLGVAGLTNAGLVRVNDGGTLQILSGLGGTILAQTPISLFASVGASTLTFNDLDQHQTFTLSGAGGVALSNSPSNRIMGVNGDEILVNNSLIVGRGTITNFSQFINNGQLSANQGTLEVQAPLGNWNAATHTLTGGTYTAFAGSTLALASLGSNTISSLIGAIVSDFGGIVTGNGSVNIFGNLTNMTNSTLNLSGAAIPASITPVGSSTLTMVNSVLNITGGGSTTLIGSYSGDPNSSLDVGAITGPTFTLPRTTLDVTDDFMNQGTVAIGNATGAATLTVGGTLSNSGSFDVGQGSNAFSADYIQTAGTTKVLTGGFLQAANINVDGGTMGGGGTFIGNVNVIGGAFAPGDPMTSTVLGDFTLGPDGEILLQIAGTAPGAFDSLDITGNLHLNGGTLDIQFIDGFIPTVGDIWNIVSFSGTQDGSGFSNIDFENAGSQHFTAFFNGQNFEFADDIGPTTAPEPSTLIATLVGLAIVAKCRSSALFSPFRRCK